MRFQTVVFSSLVIAFLANLWSQNRSVGVDEVSDSSFRRASIISWKSKAWGGVEIGRGPKYSYLHPEKGAES